MTLLEVRAAAAAALKQLHQPTHDALEHVEVLVMERPPAQVRSDAKAYFYGHQQEVDEEDEDDVTPARGQIVLIAGNLESVEEVERAVYHEISHALGGTEWDNVELGL
jgi:calcineurin-like phosphoesterase family protein